MTENKEPSISHREKTAPRVLIAEDEPLLSYDLEEILKANGCEVVGSIATVVDAITALDTAEIDIAILDFFLEDGSAEKLAQALDDRGIPYAICTGRGHMELSAKYPNAPILGKPYAAADVSLIVDSLMTARLADPRT